MRFSAIIACHNRRELTVRAIERAQRSADRAGIAIDFTVFDDGSSDRTAEAITALPSAVTVIAGDGSAYWAKSMSTAEAHVLSRPHAPGEYIVWLNDDVALDEDALERMAPTLHASPGAVIVGAVREPSGATSYSGMRRRGLHPLGFELVEPGDTTQPIDTFNGNLVFVPIAIAQRIGGLDGGFSHALADIDFGLRCNRAGIPVVLAASSFGVCPRNPTPGPKPMLQEWRGFVGPKGGGNIRSLKRVLQKSNPVTWPAFIGVSLALWWIRRLVPRRQTEQPMSAYATAGAQTGDEPD